MILKRQKRLLKSFTLALGEYLPPLFVGKRERAAGELLAGEVQGEP